MENIYMLQPEKMLEIESEYIFSDRELSVKKIKNGIILPAKEDKVEYYKFSGGVVDENYNFVAGLVRQNRECQMCWELNHIVYEPESCKRIDETVIFGGVTVTHFGHFLLDGMTRLWYYLQNPEAKNFRIAIILITCWSSYKWLFEFLSFLNIPKERIIIVDEPTQFSEIIIPEESAHTFGGLFTKEYLLPFKHITSHVKPSPLKKIFLSKSSWKGASFVCNEEYFRKFYEDRGFISVHIEEFSLLEQISIMFNAEEVVSISGTLAHLALFCRPNTRLTILTHSYPLHMLEFVRLQTFINKLIGINCVLIDVSQNFLFYEHWRGAHLIGPNQEWKQYVFDYWHEEIDDEILDASAFEYIRDWLLFYENEINSRALIDYYHSNDPGSIFLRMYKAFFGREPEQRVIDTLHNENIKAKYDKRNILTFVEKVLNRPILKIDLHVAMKGWLPSTYERMFCGDKKNPIEAVCFQFSRNFCGISYSTYSHEHGWQAEVRAGEMSGSTGKSQAIAGLRVQLEDKYDDRKYTVQYRVMFSDMSFSDWHCDGEAVYSENDVLVGIEVEIKER